MLSGACTSSTIIDKHRVLIAIGVCVEQFWPRGALARRIEIIIGEEQKTAADIVTIRKAE
jgi:hypothetical protein